MSVKSTVKTAATWLTIALTPISSSFGSPRYSGMPALTIALQSWDRRSWRTYEKKFAAWESIVERANRVLTIQTMRIVRQPAVSIRISRSRRL